MSILDKKDIEIYSSRDKIREQLIEDMKYYLDLDDLDLNKGSYVSYLIDTISALSSNLLFYNSSIYREFFLTKAIQRESVLNLAAMLGYVPPLAIPASVNILITMPLQFAGNVFTVTMNGRKYKTSDPTPFKFYTKDGTVFTLKNDVTITVTKTLFETSVNIVEHLSTEEGGGTRNLVYELNSDATQVEFVVQAIQINQYDFSNANNTELVIPTLSPYEFFIQDIAIPDQFTTDNNQISNISLTTYTNNPNTYTTWSWKQNLFLILQGENSFTYKRTDTGIKLQFGNGVIGTAPTSGDSMQLLIDFSKGSYGNVIAGSITRSDRLTVQDYNGTTYITRPVKLTVLNTVPASGGDDSPTIDEIRNKAIARVSANSRFVSKLDYQNIELIAEELPLQNTIQVLKRSDLKANEIFLYSDLLYYNSDSEETYVVPTRNAAWGYDTTSNPYDVILKSDTITIDGTDYYSMFDIEVDTVNETATYYYYMDNVDVSLSLNRSNRNVTKLLSNYAHVDLNRESNPSSDTFAVSLYYQLIDNTFDVSGLSCTLIQDWDQTEISMVHDSANKRFYVDSTSDLLVSMIPSDYVTMRFKIYDSNDTTPTTPINESSFKTVMKQNLDEFMGSKVEADSTGTYDVVVYNVPVIEKAYYDSVDNSVFDLNVYQKIVSFDVTQYRMLTDFVNLKFSNTTGYSKNIFLNPHTRDSVISVDPLDMPSLIVGDRYAVGCDNNPWGRTGGFIAEYTASGWVYEKLVTNDFFAVTSTDTEVIYNGESIVTPTLPIPFTISMVVWTDKTISGTHTALVKRIKDTLIDELYGKFGYNNSIYRSEIIRIVKSVPGVLNCYLKTPEFDIQYLYDIDKDITPQELLEYSPDLIYTDSNSISIEVR